MPLKPEQIDQIKVVDWVKAKTSLRVHHFTNEGKRSYQNAFALQRMGMNKGVSDLFFPKSSPDGQYKGLWIELKVGKNKPDKEQLKFIDEMKEEGYQAIWLTGWDAAKTYICDFYEIKL